MSHDWICKCGHDFFSHGIKYGMCGFCQCKKYDQAIGAPKPETEKEVNPGTAIKLAGTQEGER